MTATFPPLTEAQFQRQVTQLAEMLGWQWAHFRPAMRANGRWYTPVSGPLGKGWPDLVMIRSGETSRGPRRLLFAELKRSKRDQPSPDQARVLDALDDLRWSSPLAGVETYVWRPEDWERIAEVLR